MSVATQRISTVTMPWPWLSAIILAGVAALAGYLRFSDLTATSLWLDEAISVSQAGGTLAELIGKTAQDNYPPLHNVLLFISMILFGHTDFAARLPSALLSVLDVLLVFGIGVRCGLRVAGLVAATVVATSAFHIWYGHEARMYALLSFASTWFAWASLGLIQRPDLGTASWALVAAAALVYSHPFGLLNWGAIGLGGLVAILLFAQRRRYTLALYAGVGLGTALIYLPWALITIRRAAAIGSGGFWIQPPTPGAIATELGALFSGNVGLFAMAAGVALLVASAFRKGGVRDGTAAPKAFEMAIAILASWAVLPFVLSLVVSYLFQPLFLSRYLIGTIPAVALLAALGVSRWSREPAYAAAIVIAAALLGLYGYSQFKGQREDWRAAASYLNAIAQPADCVVVSPWYAMTPLTHYFVNPPACLLGQQAGTAAVPGQFAGKRVLLVGYPYAGASDDFRPALLALGYSAGESFDFKGVRVETMLPPVVPTSAQVPASESPAAGPAGDPATPAQTVAEQSTPVAATGAGLEVTVQLWGSEYLQAPSFVVMAGAEVAGSGATNAENPEQAQTFTFTLAPGDDPDSISIALTNDNFASLEQDVNLFVKSIRVGGKAVDLAKLDTSGLQWFERLADGSIALVANKDRLVVPRPNTGW